MKILIPTDKLDAYTMKDIVTEYEYDSCFLFCARKPNSGTRNTISGYAAGSNKLFYSFTLPKFENKGFFIAKMKQRTDNADRHNDFSSVMDISRQIAIGVASGLIVEIIRSLAYAI